MFNINLGDNILKKCFSYLLNFEELYLYLFFFLKNAV